MNKMKKLAFAALAVAGFSGCASAPVAERAGASAAPAPLAEVKVMRALPSYGSMGGYRYRRFAAVTVAN